MLFKFLDPKNDVAFKKIFGTEKNKDILIHFLNDMITFRENKKIVDISFLKPIQDPETISKKTSIVDILCKDEMGSTYVVEMQVAREKGFEKRAQFYASRAYVAQSHSGGNYPALKEVIFLAITNYIMFPDKKAFKSDHVVLDRETYENDLKDFSFTFLELPKFTKKVGQLNNMIEKWSYFFRHAEETPEKDLQKLIGNDPIIQKAFSELDRFSWNDQELLTYDQAEKYEWAYHASMDQKFDEGMEKGLAQGKAEGKAEGEKAALYRVVQRLLEQGLKNQPICETTGLSEQEIDKIRGSLNSSVKPR